MNREGFRDLEKMGLGLHLRAQKMTMPENGIGGISMNDKGNFELLRE